MPAPLFVCWTLHNATRSKLLWINILERGTSTEGKVLPPYLKTYDLLDLPTLEALVRRVSILAYKWEIKDLRPVNVWRLNLPHSIDWLRLVFGSWLFVASSDDDTSKISCWDLSLLFQGYREPIAEAYLPGKVETAHIEVQASGIVIAMGLGPESLTVHIITLRQHSGLYLFSELSRIEGSSHVLMLCGNFVACALRGDTIIPHIIDWRINKTYDLPPPPGGRDIPDNRCAPRSSVIWNNVIVLVRRDALQLYTLPSPTAGPVFLQSVQTPIIWEVAVVDPVSLESTPPCPLRLAALSSTGIKLCTVELDLSGAYLHGDYVCTSIDLATRPQSRLPDEEPWYHLCLSGTGRRALWLSVGDMDHPFIHSPQIVSMAIDTPPDSSEPPPLISWKNDVPDEPAVWAFPALDFDEALGLTVIGNCFGELAIYDHVGCQPLQCCGLGPDFTDRQPSLVGLLPLRPIPLGLRRTPRPTFGDTDPDDAIVSRFSQDNITLDTHYQWTTDWLGGTYFDWDLWQGIRGDMTWVLNHVYGFPGPAIPQAYAEDSDSESEFLVFRSGTRYLLFAKDWKEKTLRSFPDAPLPRFLTPSDSQLQPVTGETYFTELSVYSGMLNTEFYRRGGRNRWAEQKKRGGRPHPNLVDLPSLD
ncbi:hypothetical protein C8R44DRAFT_879890 [Mycena epipterygia]|nr:hypothetical protein C8R44DRAFT_879890 [Mycena epipterygia]